MKVIDNQADLDALTRIDAHEEVEINARIPHEDFISRWDCAL